MPGNPSRAPKELRELAGLEVRRRVLLEELVAVKLEIHRLQDKIVALGLEVPWKR